MGDTPKVVHQLRRARLLADRIGGQFVDPDEAHAMAQALDVERWAAVADRCRIDPPSADTAAMAVELLRQDAER